MVFQQVVLCLLMTINFPKSMISSDNVHCPSFAKVPHEDLNVQMQDDEEKKVKAIFLMCAYSSRHHFQFGKVNQHSVPS